MEQVPAYVLHVRPFREDSRLVDFLTPHHGRVRAVARASRRRSGGHLPMPFMPLLVTLVGRSELKTLRSWEPEGPPGRLQGTSLYSALYLNELLHRLLHEHDPHPELYREYAEALVRLAQGEGIEPVLRRFEISLLDELGYGIDFRFDVDTGEPLDPAATYALDPERGLVPASLPEAGRHRYDGGALLAIGAGDFRDEATLRTAKRLLREALAVHLGPRPLQSRALFRQ